MNCPKCAKELSEIRFTPKFLNNRSNLAKVGANECDCGYQEPIYKRIETDRSQEETLHFSCLCCNDTGFINPVYVERYFGVKTYIPSLDGVVPCKRCDRFLEIPNSDLWLVLDVSNKEICDRLHNDSLWKIKNNPPLSKKEIRKKIDSLSFGF